MPTTKPFLVVFLIDAACVLSKNRLEHPESATAWSVEIGPKLFMLHKPLLSLNSIPVSRHLKQTIVAPPILLNQVALSLCPILCLGQFSL